MSGLVPRLDLSPASKSGSKSFTFPPDVASSKENLQNLAFGNGESPSPMKKAPPTTGGASKSDKSKWISAIDPETGERYLYHEETGESKWPSPSKSTSNKTISWIKYYDDEGNEYYHNNVTGESKWVLEENERYIDGYDPAFNNTMHDLRDNESGVVDSTRGIEYEDSGEWGAFIDPETNSKYYYNEKGGVSQWETPLKLKKKKEIEETTSLTSGSFDGKTDRTPPPRSAPGSPYKNSNQKPKSQSTTPNANRPMPKSTPSSSMHSYAASAVNSYAGATTTYAPQVGNSEAIAEFLENDEDKMNKKIEKLKIGALELRIAQGEDSAWVEYQASNNGPVFYAKYNEKGGQWAKPLVFVQLDSSKKSKSPLQHESEGKTIRFGVLNRDGAADEEESVLPTRPKASVDDENSYSPGPRHKPPKTLSPSSASKVSAIESNIKKLYSTIRSKDIATNNDMNYTELKRHADQATQKWEKIIHSERVYIDDEQQQDNSDDDNIVNARRVLQSDHINDDAEPAPEGFTNDFNILYARAIVVKQVWPWTCLADIKTDRIFYRNEIEDSFQFEPPHNFNKNSLVRVDDDAEIGMNDVDDDDSQHERNDNVPKTTKYTIKHGESASQLLQRFKDELLQRRIYASRDYSQQIAASASAIQEQLQKRGRTSSGSMHKKYSVTSGATDNRNTMSGKAGLDLLKSRKIGRAGMTKKLDYTITYRPPDVEQSVLDSILTSVKSLNYKNRDTIGRDNRAKNALVRGDNHHDIPGIYFIRYTFNLIITHFFSI